MRSFFGSIVLAALIVGGAWYAYKTSPVVQEFIDAQLSSSG